MRLNTNQVAQIASRQWAEETPNTHRFYLKNTAVLQDADGSLTNVIVILATSEWGGLKEYRIPVAVQKDRTSFLAFTTPRETSTLLLTSQVDPLLKNRFTFLRSTTLYHNLPVFSTKKCREVIFYLNIIRIWCTAFYEKVNPVRVGLRHVESLRYKHDQARQDITFQ